MGDDGEELAHPARVVPELSADAGPDPVGSPVAKQDRPGRHRAANAGASPRATRAVPRLRRRPAPAWLRTLLANLLRDAFRKFARPGAVERSLQSALDQSSAGLEEFLAADLTSPSERIDRQERLVRLADALAKLPEDQRNAVELKHLQGLSLVEAAGRMGRSVPAVAGLLQRGLKALRNDLGNSWDGRNA